MFLRQITDSSLAQNAYLIGCQRTGGAIATFFGVVASGIMLVGYLFNAIL